MKSNKIAKFYIKLTLIISYKINADNLEIYYCDFFNYIGNIKVKKKTLNVHAI